jgi:hypothetical protein
MFSLEKLCLVFLTMFKWNIIFVCGYGNGKESTL